MNNRATMEANRIKGARYNKDNDMTWIKHM